MTPALGGVVKKGRSGEVSVRFEPQVRAKR